MIFMTQRYLFMILEMFQVFSITCIFNHRIKFTSKAFSLRAMYPCIPSAVGPLSHGKDLKGIFVIQVFRFYVGATAYVLFQYFVWKKLLLITD